MGRGGYVITTRDKELPEALQSSSADRLGGSFRERLDTGHLPMLEQPEAMAAVIRRFADGEG